MSVPLKLALRLAYEEVGMSQERLAELIGTHQSRVSAWVGGKNRPSLETIAAIEDATGRPRGWILERAGFVAMPTTTEQMLAFDPELDEHSRRVLRAVYSVLTTSDEESGCTSPKPHQNSHQNLLDSTGPEDHETPENGPSRTEPNPPVTD
jgi:transcriptional regulator with XRE-family HTH domain